jgi:TolB protein
MDDERRIRAGLERMASEVPPTGRPPERFRSRARRRMALSATAVVLAVAVVAAGSVAGLRALDREAPIGTDPTPPPPTSGPAESPTPSPFVPHIAFQSDRDGNDDIWIMEANGDNPRNLTNDPASDRTPTWSPDGTKIAFASDRSGDFDIWVMAADGSNPVDLTKSVGDETAPRWSPNGGLIAYLHAEPPSGSAQTWLMGADGSDQRGLLLDDKPHGEGAWSPDGSSFVFSRAGRLWMVAINDAGEPRDPRRLTDGPIDQEPSWCPDGHPIAYVRGEKDPDIWLLDPAGGEPLRMTHGASSAMPAWNAAGNAIVFVHVTLNEQGRISAGISVQALSGGVERLTPDDAGVRDFWPAPQPI